MNMEIYTKDNEKVQIVSEDIINYRQLVLDKRASNQFISVDFTSIKELKGNKIILEKAFQNQKAESLEL